MKKLIQTSFSDTLLTGAEDEGEQKDFEVVVWQTEPDDVTPYKISLGCFDICLFDADLKKIVRALNAAMRIRKQATPIKGQEQ